MLKVLRKNAPVKKRYIRANEAPFMNKVREKEIIKWWQHKNVFLKKKKNTWKSSSIWHRKNYCASLLRKEKRNYFENIDTSKNPDNKIFWKTVKRMFHSCYIRKLPSAVAIFENHQGNVFSFGHVSLDEITKKNKKIRCEEGLSGYGYYY